MDTSSMEERDKAIREAFIAIKKDILKLQKSRAEHREALSQLIVNKEEAAKREETRNVTIGSLKQNVSAIQGFIGEVEELKKDYSVKANLSKKIRDVDRKIDLLKTDLVQESDLAEFESLINKLSGEINSIKGDYAKSLDIDEIESRQGKKIHEAEKGILSRIESLQEGFASQNELASLKSKIEELRKDYLVSDSVYRKIRNVERSLKELDFVKQDKIVEAEGSIKKISKALESIKDTEISNIEREQKKLLKALNELKSLPYELKQLRENIKAKSIDPELLPEIKALNKKIDKIDKDNKLLMKRDAIQAAIKRHRKRKIDAYKSIASYVFIGLLTFSIAMYFYTNKNPMMFPGIREKIGIVIGGLVIILLYLYAPFEKIYPYFKKKGEGNPIVKEKLVKEEPVRKRAVKPVAAKKEKPKKKGPSVFDKVVDFFAKDEQ